MFDLFRIRLCTSISAFAFAFATVAVSTPPAHAENPCGETYTVQRGDTLARIARKCDETVPAILAANDQIGDPSQLRIGWTIRIPGQEAASATTTVSETPTRVAGVRGQIVNSRRCAQLHTPDGEVYGLVSPNVLFRSGAVVKVSGAFARKTACNAERTIVVSELVPGR